MTCNIKGKSASATKYHIWYIMQYVETKGRHGDEKSKIDYSSTRSGICDVLVLHYR